jgi:hypothetical protein
MKVKSKTFLLLSAIFLTACGSSGGPHWTTGAEQLHKWGYYSGAPVTRWESDGLGMTLLSELRYTDPKGVVWIAPIGSKVNGASIPRSLWSFMGGPFEGKYRNASVLHDVAYEQHARTWQECDRMFYNAMRCSGVGAIEAKTMYYSLYRFGRHGEFAIKRAKRVKPSEAVPQTEELPRAIPMSATEIDATRDWIRGTDPSLEEIEARATEPR